jgi:hypothetical protein
VQDPQKETQMPTIANPNLHQSHPSPSHGSAPTDAAPTLTRGITARIHTAWHRASLTGRLADGVDPAYHPELGLRATQLTSPRNRATLARTLRRIIAEAHRPAMSRSNVILIRRGPVLKAEDELRAMVTRLLQPAPVSPQGMAQLERILTNADHSPLYNAREPQTLNRQLAAALRAMDSGAPTSHEFSIGR